MDPPTYVLEQTIVNAKTYKNYHKLKNLYESIPVGTCSMSCPCTVFRQTHYFTKYGRIFAGTYGHICCISELFEYNHIDDDSKYLIFIETIKHGHIGCIKYIIDYFDAQMINDCAQSRSLINDKNGDITKAACMYHDATVVKLLEKAGFKLHSDKFCFLANNKSSKVLEYLLHDINMINTLDFIIIVKGGVVENLKVLYERSVKLDIYKYIKDPNGIVSGNCILLNYIDCLNYLISINWDNARKVYKSYLCGHKIFIDGLFKGYYIQKNK